MFLALCTKNWLKSKSVRCILAWNEPKHLSNVYAFRKNTLQFGVYRQLWVSRSWDETSLDNVFCTCATLATDKWILLIKFTTYKCKSNVS